MSTRRKTPLHDRLRSILTHSWPTTIAELAHICGASRKGVTAALLKLERSGEVKRDPGRIVNEPHCFTPAKGLKQPGEPLAIAEPKPAPESVPGARVVLFLEPRASPRDSIFSCQSVAWNRPSGAPC